MGLFNKLANILFDEEETEEEIPTITKNDEIVKKRKEEISSNDDVVVTKVETKKEIKEEVVEMPKTVKEEDIHTKKFTFPFMDDDDEIVEEMPKRNMSKTREDYSYANVIRKEEPKEPKKREFLSPKSMKEVKSDAYSANRNNIYDPTNTEHKPFTLSPIISPVYGILNENYTKDDIVEKNSAKDRTANKIDFDSVRRKAYGTLEDEIEVSLTRPQDEDKHEEEIFQEMTIDNLKEDGISINDLLIDDDDDEKTGELFDIEEISDMSEEDANEVKSLDIEDEEIENSSNSDDKSDDLFDLIDSIYAGKDKE